MTTVYLAPGPFGAGGQFFGLGGLPLNLGTITTYAAGSTTPLATYTTSAGSVQNANPIPLGIDGRPPNEIWITGVAYRFDLKDSLGNLIKTYDNLSTFTASANLSFLGTATGEVETNVSAFLNLMVKGLKKNFGAVGDGVANDSVPLSNALNSGKIIEAEDGTFLIVTGAVIAASSCEFRGYGIGATIIKYAPTANGTLLSFTKGASVIQYCSVQDIQLYSADSTHTKKAIAISDGDNTTIKNVLINGAVVVGSTTYWSGANSVGIQLNGRQIGLFKNVAIAADKPIAIGVNPNSSISIDHHQFDDLYMIGNGNPLITIDSGVNLSNVTFDGEQAWVLGTDGLYWVDTTTTVNSDNLRIENVRREQSSSSTSYVVRIEHNHALQGFNIENFFADPTCRGLYLRKVLNTKLDTFLYPNSTGVALDIDATVKGFAGKNCYWESGSTVTVTGQRLIQLSPKFVSGAPLSPDFIYQETANTIRQIRSEAAYQGVNTSIAQDATAVIAIHTFLGMVFIIDDEGGMSQFALKGTFGNTFEVSDPTGIYSVTLNNAGTYNVYRSGTDYVIQNKRAGTHSVKWFLVGGDDNQFN